MKDGFLKGFEKIRADRSIILKTKKLMSGGAKRRKPFRAKKLAYVAVPAVLTVAVLSSVFINDAGRFAVKAKAQDLMDGVKPQTEDVSGAVTDGFVLSAQNFSSKLFKMLHKNGENTLVSPASAYFALGLTANGAGGKTLSAFLQVLGKHGMTAKSIDKACKACEDWFTENRGGTSVKIANSIWYRTGFRANRDFLQTNADYFGAAAQTLDFDSAASVGVINDWVKRNTSGRIEKIADRLEPDDMMHIINALSFDAKWIHPFDTEQKAFAGEFALENGGSVKAPFMSLDADLDCMKGADASAVLLPYGGGRFAMLCILPDKNVGLKNYIDSLDENTIPRILSGKTMKKESVILPEFKVSFDKDLDDALKKMGLSVAFEQSADFSGMGGRGLYIGRVREKTFLQVDELGTQAGAATDVVMQKMCAEVGLDFNRPFLYAVVDTKEGLPLFIGAMENPQAES